MREQKIDIFDQRVLSKANAICVTTNGIVKVNGELVMGAGVAKLFATKWPRLPRMLGNLIQNGGNHVYSIPQFSVKDPWIVSFPTKDDYLDKSSLSLIRRSAVELMELTNNQNWELVALPFPGIGMGGLNPQEVREAISPILDNRIIILSK